MNDKLVSILAHWGLQDCEVNQIYDTAWQVGEDYILKEYHDFNSLERNLKMLRILGEMDIPVGQAVPSKDNALYVSKEKKFYFLSKRLSGSNLVKIDDIQTIATEMGKIIANLHAAFKKCEDMGDFWENSLLDEMNGWVKQNFEKSNWARISREEYEKTISQLASVYDRLPVQLIHRDVHFGNFLFADGKFSGYIDFDLSQRNIRIFDLCYFLAGLRSEEEEMQLTDGQWFEFLEFVFKGYGSILKLSEMEKKAVPYVMECIELLFVSYFEGENDSEYADNAYEIYQFIREHEDRIWDLQSSGAEGWFN